MQNPKLTKKICAGQIVIQEKQKKLYPLTKTNSRKHEYSA